jgi:hypothetical protein
LYDAGCSQKARELLATGHVDEAINEWRRLADLGSGSARCVLAYIYFRGAPTILPDLDEARRLAIAGMPTSRGYANYLLGCFALAEGKVNVAIGYFKISYEANFVPVLTILAWTQFRNNIATGKRQQGAVKLALRAIHSGHLPARGLLCRIYFSGQLGFTKRCYGAIVFPWALMQYGWGMHHDIFSINCFHYSPTFKLPLFHGSLLNRIGG